MWCSVIRSAAASSGVVAETVIGSAVIHWRTRASLECTRPARAREHVARREDADQASVLGDERRADVERAHPLGDLAERVLGRDHERVVRHDVADRRPRPLRLSASSRAAARGGRAGARHRARVELDLARGTPARPGSRAAVPASPREEGGEVTADDLRRRPPEGLRARLRRFAGAARELAAEIARLVRRSAAARAGRAGTGAALSVDAGRGRDRLRGRLGLLGGDAALLDGKGRDVAGGVDVRQAGDASVQRRRGRSPRTSAGCRRSAGLPGAGARRPGRRRRCSSPTSSSSPARASAAIRARVHGDPALASSSARTASLASRPNSWSGSCSGVTRVSSTPAMPRVGDPGRRHQRELVCGKAPDGAGRHGEGDSPHLAGLDLAPAAARSCRVRRPAERDRAVDCRSRHRRRRR